MTTDRIAQARIAQINSENTAIERFEEVQANGMEF